jgi:hypothetical protein
VALQPLGALLGNPTVLLAWPALRSFRLGPASPARNAFTGSRAPPAHSLTAFATDSPGLVCSLALASIWRAAAETYPLGSSERTRLMLRRTAVLLSALLVLPYSVGAQETARDSLRGQPLPGFAWETRSLSQVCEARPPGQANSVSIALDSADVVSRARRALAPRIRATDVVTLFVRTSEGVFLRFDLRNRGPNTKDGTSSVYVDKARCVTLLGW